MLLCSLLVDIASSLHVPFGRGTQISQQQVQQPQQKEMISSPLGSKLMQELEEYQHSSYETHRSKVNSLLSSLGTSTSTADIDEFVSSLKHESSSCFFFASTFDGIKDSENTNINDVFWRTAVKNKKLSIDADGKSQHLQPTSELPRAGPFVVPSSPTKPDIYVSMQLPLGTVRYTYSIEKEGNALRVNFLEFQWILMGKMVYNRVINREEEWKVRYTGIGKSEHQDGLMYIDIRNKNTVHDGVYDRSIAIKSVIPSGVSLADYVVGDPSLTVITNIDIGEKTDLMKKISRVVSSCLSKPESYVAIAILDNQSVIWGGEDVPCMIGNLNSLGAINLENNKAIMEQITEIFTPYGIRADHMYITFNDIARENMGYNGKTFAG